MRSFFRIQRGQFSRKALQALVGAVLVLTGVVAAPIRHAQAAGRIVVNTLADTMVDDGVCSLREAIDESNNPVGARHVDCALGAIGLDNIYFSVTGTINVNSPLPRINQPLNIFGPGSYNARPSVIINGGNHVDNGFYVSPNVGEIVRIIHMGIVGFTNAGIYVSQGAPHLFAFNYIGTDGTNARPNGSGIIVSLGHDVWIQNSLISGNTHWGVKLLNGGTKTRLDDNKIGYSNTLSSLPNGDGGIYFDSGSTAIIKGNLIGNHSGADDKAIWLWDGSILSGSSGNCLGNDSYGLVADNHSTAVFDSNWWGHSNGPTVSATIWGDRLVQLGSSTVVYSPFTTTRPAWCPR